jgi:clan AA aspartic protease
MIEGVVSHLRPIVRLTLRDAIGQEWEIEAVMDTGFTGFLTLPPNVVARLSLPFTLPMPATLADGSQILLSVYKVIVLWDGAERDIDVLATGTEPLIGMSLLEGSDVAFRAEEGGRITISRS